MKRKENFSDMLRKQGYEVTEKELKGGKVNKVRLITAQRDGQRFEYALKTYKSEDDMNDMIRGYDKLNNIVKTPQLVYVDKESRTAAYDFVGGKSISEMIENGDNDASKALTALAKELQKLHDADKYHSEYRHGDSPDEKKMIRHAMKALIAGKINKDEAKEIVSQIKKYIPAYKAIIHGDAHLGNFRYWNGEVYIMDPDNVKMSDPNADIGKVIDSINKAETEGRITAANAKQFKELFLGAYEGEDKQGVEVNLLRTPLIVMKENNDKTPSEKKRIRAALNSLEERVAAALLFIILAFSAFNGADITGRVVQAGSNAGSLFSIGLIFFAGIIIAFLVLNNNSKAQTH